MAEKRRERGEQAESIAREEAISHRRDQSLSEGAPRSVGSMVPQTKVPLARSDAAGL